MIRTFVSTAAYALLVAICSSAAAYAASAPVLTVESVLSPAWVERANGRREPLTVGMPLANKEKVHTGDGGRAMLRMADGSAVKLGESALLGVDDLVTKAGGKKGGIVGASLDVVRGAFRFTTGLLAKSESERDVKVKVRAVTAGIRGTDVWGKSDDDRDVVCLLEGRIDVSHGASQFVMQEPLSFYIAPLKGQAQPPSRVTEQQIMEWSAETEIDPRTGAARAGGTGLVIVASSADERTAAALREKLRDSGFPADVGRFSGGPYEVRIASLADTVEASMLAQRLRGLGYKQARAAQ